MNQYRECSVLRSRYVFFGETIYETEESKNESGKKA